MKKTILIFTTAIIFMTGSVWSEEKLVFIDFAEVFNQFYKTQLARDRSAQQKTELEHERELMNKEVEGLREKIEALRADARDESLSKELRYSKRNQLEERLVELQKRDQEVLDFVKLRESQLLQQRQRVIRKIIDEIQEEVNAYAKEKGYAAVIDRSSTSVAKTPVILFVDPKSDITDELISRLNENMGSDANSGIKE